jgi:PAS domain S-box-containing protein
LPATLNLTAMPIPANAPVPTAQLPTAQLATEQRLHDSQALLDRVGRLAGVGGWTVDLLTNQIAWSDHTCHIHDVPTGTTPSMAQALSYYPPAARQAIAKAMAHITQNGGVYDIELPIVTAHNRQAWVHTIGEAQLHNGKVVRLIGAIQDITKRRQMQDALAASNHQLRQLYEQTPALLVAFDEAGRVQSASGLWLAALGYSRDEVMQRPVFEFFCDTSRRRALGGEMATLFATGSCHQVPCGWLRRDGSLLKTLVSAIVQQPTPATEAAEATSSPPPLRQALAVMTDLTEALARSAELQQEQALRQQLQSHTRELDGLLSERNEMLHVLAHEVRQPLHNASAALQSATGVLADHGEHAAFDRLQHAQAVLGAVMAGVDNTLAVASVLATNRGGSGSGNTATATAPADITLADTDLELLLAIAVADMPSTDRARVQLQWHTATRTAWADAGLMRLALRNLLANALAFSPPNAPVVLRVSDADHPLALMLDVIDQGPGLAADVVPRLFERGVRSRLPPPAMHPQHPHPQQRRLSHGLGLYIVRRAMQLQGGTALLLHTGPGGTGMRLQLNESGNKPLAG